VLEEELLPQVELADGDAVFLTDVGDRGLLDEVFAEQGDLLLGSEVAALPGHGCSSEGVLPLTPSKANSCFGWGKTGGTADTSPDSPRPGRRAGVTAVPPAAAKLPVRHHRAPAGGPVGGRSPPHHAEGGGWQR